MEFYNDLYYTTDNKHDEAAQLQYPSNNLKVNNMI